MQNSSVKLEYNINGIGIITPIIYNFPKGLYQNKNLNLERKLRDTNQLGAIRYIHNGAHYTRYEYVLLQYMLINFVQKNSEIGLGSKFNFKSWDLDKELKYEEKITAAEVIELIVLFANMGHFKDTFSSNKVWFHYILENHYGVKNGLKKGLSSEGKKLLDKLLEDLDYQHIQWLNALYMLSRTSELQDYRVICEKIVKNILYHENDKWMDLYNKIRKVSYIVLDSHFSYIPIEISLQNVLFNHSLFIDEILKNNSNLFGTLERISELLEDTLYLENNALLVGTYRSIDIYNKLNDFLSSNEDLREVAKINKLILNIEESPLYEESNIIENEIPWNKEKNLSLTFRIKERRGFPVDVFKREMEILKKLGTDVYLGYNFSPSFEKYRTVYSLNKTLSGKKLLNKCLSILSQGVDDYLEYKHFALKEVNNGPLIDVVTKKIITFLFRNILKNDYFCEYNYSNKLCPFILEIGSKKALSKLDLYIGDFKKIFPDDKDGLHELTALRHRVSNINYKGLTIVYAGSLRFIDSNKKAVCELDGLILTPKNKKKYLEVIEAKNLSTKSQRKSVAMKQLREKFLPIVADSMVEDTEVKEIDNFGAYVNLMRK
ncbi:hypothetical protein [Niallia sp. MER TA 168]|uniref:hypothetical protein n=1 Tax=Niallia sp. MER TA 168 TaxID=2939568 RepID=UPI00203DAAFB|nr:hypothetical protein [Niallia sp. MER TA 168]MCM3361273.1 hypothetical protein [Niallia sp. MER TA 168]